MNKDENKKKRKKKEQKYIGDGVLSLVLNQFFLVVGLFWNTFLQKIVVALKKRNGKTVAMDYFC